MDNMDSLEGSMRLEAARKLYIKAIEDMQRDMTGFKDTNDEILAAHTRKVSALNMF